MPFRITILLFCCLLLTPLELHAAPKESMLYVQVRQSKLRSQPEFWSPTVADISYGTALAPLGAAPSNKSWIKAKLGESEGYVHVSAVTARKIVLSSSTKGLSAKADSSDVVLAGKGFNNQVENAYKASKKLDYASVDEVEKNSVESAEENAFIKDGKLNEK